MYREGQTATNPKTGQKVVFKDGQWVNAGVDQSLVVSDGKAGISGPEARSADVGDGQAYMAREVLGGLAKVEALNRRVPAGRFNTMVAGWQQNLPSGWQPSHIPLWQMMQAQSRSLLMPGAELQSGKALGASQINSERELEYWASTIPNAAQEPAAVTDGVNRLGAAALRRIAREEYAKRWREQFGNLKKTDARGRTFEQAFDQFQQSPASAPMRRPLSDYVSAAEKRRLGGRGKAGAGRVPTYNPATGEFE